MASPQQIKTTVTDLLKIKHPILLAGMGGASGSKLAAAVTNAGGMGVIGGNGYTPAMLKDEIAELKSYLHDKNAPFGVDLLIPQIGGNARKTNSDYNKGKLVLSPFPSLPVPTLSSRLLALVSFSASHSEKS